MKRSVYVCPKCSSTVECEAGSPVLCGACRIEMAERIEGEDELRDRILALETSCLLLQNEAEDRAKQLADLRAQVVSLRDGLQEHIDRCTETSST